MDGLKELIDCYVSAKRKEKEAEASRVALGDAIAKALEHDSESSKTYTVDEYKVKVKCVVNRKVDLLAMAELGLENQPVKTIVKKELDLEGLRWFEANDPTNYQRILTTITATPGRTSVEVEEVKK